MKATNQRASLEQQENGSIIPKLILPLDIRINRIFVAKEKCGDAVANRVKYAVTEVYYNHIFCNFEKYEND